MNKYSDFDVLKNSVLTPDLVKQAFNCLPSNYIIKVQEKIQELVSERKMKRNYTKSYISKVRTGENENEDILLVMVWVGLKSAENKSAFEGRKKASITT